MISAPVLKTERLLKEILDQVLSQTDLHARWLNTLSYMEHIGATQIARTQSGPRATFFTLKHAAEEARHGFYLKKLALKVLPDHNPSYAPQFLLAPILSRQYLYRLDLLASRLCRQVGLQAAALHDLAYLLVTYAIEVRADEIYPIYQAYLKDYQPVKLSVQGIINEEEGHLAEMEEALAKYPAELRALTSDLCQLENKLYREWLEKVWTDLN